jgi:hypothetical protein
MDPFGLTNAPAIFQHLMNDVFCEYLDDFVVCYIDDIFIFSKNLEEDEHIQFVLDKFKEVEFYAKLEKCEFHQIDVALFNYIIFGDGIRMDPCKIQTIVDWTTLASIQEVQCFLGFANFYQHFIAHYYSIMAPFTWLTRKDQPFP